MQGQWSHTAAGKRYTRRFMPTMLFYVVAILGTTWIDRHYHPQGIALTALALLPALALVVSIVVMGLYFVEESDEYLRHRVAMASLAGTGFMLAVTSVWGFLEEAGQLPHMPAYWAYILWCLGMGVAQCFFSLRSLKGGEA